MAKNGRQKGAVAEREVAEILRQWWSKLEPGCRFLRTPGSGGWATPEVRGHFKTAGDLLTTATRFPFAVEVKRREKEWSMPCLFDGMPTGAWKWWRQACAAALEQKGVPMLWLRKSREGWFVMVPASFGPSGRRPDVWWPEELLRRNRADFGDVLPVLYLADNLLAHHPRQLALPVRRQHAEAV
jgi:hypothetical protein